MNLCSQINVKALGWQPYWFSRWPTFKNIHFDIASNGRERVMQIKKRLCQITKTMHLDEQKFWGKIVVHPCIHPPSWISKWPPSKNMFFRTFLMYPSIRLPSWVSKWPPSENLVFSIFSKLRGIGSSFQRQN